MPFGKGAGRSWAGDEGAEHEPRVIRATHAWGGPVGGGKGASGGGGISTMHVSGWPLDCTDREMENYCRFFPGFVAAKANLKGQPKLWARFDCPANALAAMTAIDGQPFDWRDPEVLLWASTAKTDLNPDRMGRPKGPICMAGCIEELLGGLLNANSTVSPVEAGKGATPVAVSWEPGGPGGTWTTPAETPPFKRPDAPEAAAPWPKRPRTESMATDEEIDTLVIIRPAEAGLSNLGLHEFFLQVEGYVALRMGGANCFVKFLSPAFAQAAVTAAGGSGLQAAMARSNMNVSQATHFADASVDVAE